MSEHNSWIQIQERDPRGLLLASALQAARTPLNSHAPPRFGESTMTLDVVYAKHVYDDFTNKISACSRILIRVSDLCLLTTRMALQRRFARSLTPDSKPRACLGGMERDSGRSKPNMTRQTSSALLNRASGSPFVTLSTLHGACEVMDADMSSVLTFCEHFDQRRIQYLK